MAEEKQLDQLSSEALYQAATAAPEPAPTPEPPAPEVQEPEPQPTPVPPTPAQPPDEAVPPWRLREEADARRLAEDRARQLEVRLAQIQAHQQQQQKPPDFFEHPDQATQMIVNRMLQPIVEQQQKAQMYMGKMIADQIHGADTVSTAEQAFLKARDDMTLDPMDYERVVQSPNRYDACVQWHRRQTVLSKVGDDPGAWFKQELKNQLADPKFQAEILEAIKGQAAAKPSVVKLPPSLSKATATAANSGGGVDGDMSDSSLFAHAMKR